MHKQYSIKICGTAGVVVLGDTGGGVNVGVSHGVGKDSSFLSHTVNFSEETGFSAVPTFGVGRIDVLMNRTL